MDKAAVRRVSEHFSSGGLPVEDVLPDLQQKLRSSRLAALKAPAGSGKTILCPLALLASGDYEQVYVLEPRRVTARLPALALEEVVGSLVGYRIRLESRWQEGTTRVGYLTYGTALRRFVGQPPGPNDLVIFDEFHERPWEAELLLASLRALPTGPKLLLMSATLEVDSLPSELPVVESDGRLHPVTISWEPKDPLILQDWRKLASLVAERSSEWATKERGEQLIFLPGISAIRAVEERLRADHISGPVDILHSSLPEQEIRRVVERPVNGGFRRILSTDLAESSVTLPGIRVVIDAGLVRRPIRDELDLGVTLKTEGAPLASLEQRAGRAGRVGPGFCHRLFTRADELHRSPFPKPQITQADYRTITLHLAILGLLERVKELPWLHSPCENKMEACLRWCREQGLLSADYAITEKGRWVLRLPTQTRIANFAVSSRIGGLSIQDTSERVQALERGSPESGKPATLETAIEKLKQDQRLHRQVKAVLAKIPISQEQSLEDILLETYGDCVARFQSTRAVCAKSGQAALEFQAGEHRAEAFGLVLSTYPRGGSGPRSGVGLYTRIDKDQIWESLFDNLQETEHLRFDPSSKTVLQCKEVKLDDLVLEAESQPATPSAEVAKQLLQQMDDFELSAQCKTLIRRLELYFWHRSESTEEHLGQLPEAPTLEKQLLLHFLQTVNRLSRDFSSEFLAHLSGVLPYPLTQDLNRSVPATVNMPRRRKPVSIEYPPEGDPILASKLQDFFGWQPPQILGGKVKLLFHLLAPNGRACQITYDLEGFWRGSYAQVRKDLRGRYPKHDWPENPK